MPRPSRKPLHYFLFNKPYGVVSQFTPLGTHKSLKDFGPFPHDVYPVGRLDADSEGLLLLTNDDTLKHRLTDPKYGHSRIYLAQVENIPTESELYLLRRGVTLAGIKSLPLEAEVLSKEPDLPSRAVPIRYRKNVPTSWIRITLHEGKNRQVRRMTAAIGHPTLRLVRTGIDFLELAGLQPGEHRPLTAPELNRLRISAGLADPV